MIPYLTIFRFTMYFSIVVFWPMLSVFIARANGLDQAGINILIAYRWRIAMLLFLVEMLVIQNIIGQVMSI